ncbi:MAG: protein kinase [Myxococcota bacterium]
MTGCPDPSVLESFLRGSLDHGTRASVEQHLDTCHDCAATFAEFARLFGSASVEAAPMGPSAWDQATLDGTTNPEPGTSGVHDKSSAPPSPTVGRYQLGRRLGAGGMGVVFEAHDPELHRQVAIKLLHPGQSDEAEMTRERLLREARAMARLAHPNVVAVHDVGRVGEQVFVAMELVEGDTLTRWLKASPRSRAEIVERFVHAGRGLEAAHAVGLVHRDFKPDNVLMGADARARVTDFGLARPVLAWAETEPMPASPSGVDPMRVSIAVTTAFGVIAGTPAYMAPEQWRGQAVDARSDQFSFCVALFEALFGVRPFEGDQWMVLSDNVMAGRVRTLPRATQGSAPRWLRAAILRGLSVEPDDRHPSMAALLAALSRDRSAILRVGAIVGAMALGAAATVGVLAWIADETTPAPPDESMLVDTPGADSDAEARPDDDDEATPSATGQPSAPADEACLALARSAGGHWTPERRAAVHAHIADMEDGDVLARLATPVLDRWVDDYTTQAEATCTPAPDLEFVDARRRCLSARVARLDAWALRLLELQTFQAESAVVGSARGLPALSRCNESKWLLGMPAAADGNLGARVRLLTADLAAAEADASLFQLTSVGEAAERIAKEAEALGHPPLLAEAQLLVGTVAATRYDPDVAAQWLERAVLTAETGKHLEAQSAAATELIVQRGAGLLDPVGVKPWQRIADSLAERTGDVGLRGEAELARARMQHATLEFQDAAKTFEEAVDHLARTYSRDDPRLAMARVAWAELLLDLGDPVEAERQAAHACEDLRRALGPGDLRLGVAQAVLARAQLLGGKPDDALRSAELAVDIPGMSRSLRHDYDHGDALLVKGDVLAAKGDVAGAFEAYEKAEIYHYVGPRKAQPMIHRAALLLATGDPDAGLRQYEQALAELETHYEADDPRLVEVLRALGAARRAQGKVAAAREPLERALAIADKAIGFGPFKARSLIDLAHLERAAGNDARALELFDDAHVPLMGAYDMDHPQIVVELLARADLAFALGDEAYAGRLYRTNVERLEAIYGAESPQAQRARERRTDDE